MDPVTLTLAKNYYHLTDAGRQALYDEIKQAYESGALKGDPGEGLHIMGALGSPDNLPPTGEPGQSYMVGIDLWTWAVDQWVNAGPLQGPQGDKGDPGYTPVKGVDYFDGEQGLKGDTGAPFVYTDFTPEQLTALTGPQGDKGDPFVYADFTPEQLAGLKGPKGDPGTTSWAGITDKPATFPPSAHEHTPSEVGLGNVTNVEQMPVAGGTFTGVATAHNNTSYTTEQLRNIRLYADGETIPTLANGSIALVYEV